MPSAPSVLIGLLKTAIRSDDPALVTNLLARREAEAAAEDLAARGVSVEIIDPRTLVPFDFDTIAASVRKTRRLLVVQEAPFPGSWGATLGGEQPVRLARVRAERARRARGAGPVRGNAGKRMAARPRPDHRSRAQAGRPAGR